MDEQNTPASGTPSQSPIYQESQEKNAKWLWLLIVLIIIGALVFSFFRGIGPFAQLRPGGGEEETVSPTPQSSISSPSPSPSPEAEEVDRSEPAVRVLNGSGTVGVASSVQVILEELGWVVLTIGNADNYDFEQTEIVVKEGFENFGDVIAEDLSNSYSVVVSSDLLDATDSADIEVIVGSQ